MEQLSSNIDFELAAKYLAGGSDASEISQFESWLSISVQNQLEFDELRAIWNVPTEPFNEVGIDGAWNKVSNQVSETIQTKLLNINSFSWAIATSVMVMLCVGTAFWYLTKSELEHFESGDYIATLTLSDGTEIALQEDSWIDYPAEFDGRLRQVKLDGTAYFKVASDKEHPFIIETHAGIIKVVGTAFEVNTRDEISDLVVEVEEGTVEVANRANTNFTKVTAGQICTLGNDLTKLTVVEIDDPSPFFWKDKTIKFRRTEMSQVISVLEDLLNITIEVDNDAINQCEISATFVDENADTILDIIATALGLNLTKNGDSFTLSGNGC
jgi:transmembrane sensor